ncbi:MAG TPA: copper resistance protein CopC [Ktedonobacteraceae bacterium]|jgi:copper transport protein
MVSISRRHIGFMHTFIVTFAMALLLFLLVPLFTEAHSQLPFHAQYDHSDPPANARLPSGHPPTQVQVWFTEQVDPNFSKLAVFNQQQHEVDLGNSHIAPNDPYSLIISLHPSLPDEAYTVVFHTVSAEDGHEVTSGFSFVVGGGALPTNTSALLSHIQTTDNNLNAWSVTIRWLNYLGLAGLVGSLMFLLLIWRPSAQELRIRLVLLDEANAQIELRTLWFSFGCLLILFLGWASFLIYQASTSSASAPWQIFGNSAVTTVLLHSRFGVLWLLRLALLLLAFILWFLWYRNKAREGRPEKLLWFILFAGVGMMSTNSLDSHAAANRAALVLVPADLLHLVSTGLWVGGLFSFILILPVALRTLVPGTGDRTRVIAVLIPRFTVIAMLSVALLAVTGMVQALVQLNVLNAFLSGNEGQVLSAFLGSSYGQALILKSALFALLIGLGAFNAFRISPLMQRFAVKTSEEDGAGSFAAGRLQRIFRRAVKTEVLIALCLLLVVGGLTSLSPPPAPSAPVANGPLIRQGQMADLTYHLAINPGKVGPNTFEITLTDKDGQPVQHADAIVAYFIMEDMDMGTEVLNFTPIKKTPGYYGATASILSMSGHWGIELIVRRNGFDDAKTMIQCTIGT